MRQRMIKTGILLLILMILFTVLSRAAYNLSTAEVSTEKASPQTFAPELSAQGIVAGKKEIAVSAEENLRVGSVYVAEGQAVKKGELLFELDLKELAEKIEEGQQELKSLDLQIQGAAEAEAAASAGRQLTLAQAQEDYSRSAVKENNAVDKAYGDLVKAQKKYQDFVDSERKKQKNLDEEGAGRQGDRQEKNGEIPSDQETAVKEEAGASGQEYNLQTDTVQREEELLLLVEEKQAAYDQALQEREDSLYQAEKAIDSAGIDQAKDYSMEQTQITRSQKKKELAKLKKLYDGKGRIMAPVRGLVTAVTVTAGSTTTGGGDILLSDATGGGRLSVTFPKEMRKYIQEGLQAVVTAADSGDGQQAASDHVKIRSVTEQGQSADSPSGGEENASQDSMPGEELTVSVNLPPDHFNAGDRVTLKVEAKADSYDTCIPTGALHMMSGNQYYVNVAEKKTAVLGEEWVIRQVVVELVDKNEKYAAVEGISSEQEIVTEASRALENGSRVKVKNETD